MPLINSIWTNYNGYLTWSNGRSYRQYITILYWKGYRYVLDYNPDGISSIGIQRRRHDIYKGFFSSLTLKLKFSLDPGHGGSYLKIAYDDLFVRSDIDIEIYKINVSTNDFDIFYTGKIDFSTYLHDRDFNYIECSFNEGGDVAEFLANDELIVDVLKTINIFGETITDEILDTIELTPIDIYLVAQSTGSRILSVATYNGTATITPYNSLGTEITNNIGTDANPDPDPMDLGKIYINNTGETTSINVKSDIRWDLEATVDAGCYTQIRVYIDIFNNSDVLVSHVYSKLFTYDNLLGGTQITSDSGDYENIETGYFNVLPDYYIRYWAQIYYTTTPLGEVYVNLLWTNNQLDIILKSISRIKGTTGSVFELSNTTCDGYYIEKIGKKLIRMITHDADFDLICPSAQYDFITNGELIRQYPTTEFKTSFREFFKMINSYEGVYLDYSSGVFTLRKIASSFKNSLGGNFGTVRNFTEKPSEILFNSVKLGVKNFQNEDFETAFDYSGTFNYSTGSSFKKDLDLTGNYITGTISFELTRRQPYWYFGKTEYRANKEIFLVRCSADLPVLASNYNASGFPGLEQYYNLGISPYFAAINHGALLKACLYLSGQGLRYVSSDNKNDVNFIYSSVAIDLFSNIATTNMLSNLYLPINIECDAVLDITDDITDPYEYFTISDKNGNSMNIYFEEFETNENNTGIKIKGLRRV